MWYQSENSSSTKPLEVEKTSTTVFLRKDFKLIPEQVRDNEIVGEHWSYLERKMTLSEYSIYSELKAETDYIAMMTEV